jgi:hypothetical protein
MWAGSRGEENLNLCQITHNGLHHRLDRRGIRHDAQRLCL